MEKISNSVLTSSITNRRTEGMKDRSDSSSAADHPRFCGEEGCEKCERAHPDADPHCKVCGGSGFVHPLVGHIAKPDYSRTIPCSAPGCHAATLKVKVAGEPYDERRGVSRLQTMENFSPREGAVEAKKAAELLVLGDAPPFLILYGNVGCGKTHLCNAVGLKLAQDDRKVLFRRADDLLDYLREGIDEHELRSRIIECQVVDVLIIDDFESAKLKSESWRLEKMEQILDHRYHAGLVTMITTNDDWKDDWKGIPRIKDRFLDKAVAKMVHISAPTYRPLKKRNAGSK